MLNEIGGYLETNIAADLGVGNYPTQADLPLRTVQQGDEQPITSYPALIIVEGSVRPDYAEFGTGDPSDGIDRIYEFRMYGSTPAATRAAARAAVETLAERLEAWIIANNGLGGLADGSQVVHESTPGAWEPVIQGSGSVWFGHFMIPVYVKTSQ